MIGSFVARRLPSILLLATAVLAAPAATAEEVGIAWTSWKSARAQIPTEPDRPILLFCKYRFCGSCARMEEETFSDPELARWVEERFVPARQTLWGLGDFVFPELRRDGEKLRLDVTPTLIVIRGDDFRLSSGFKTPEQLRQFLERATAELGGS